MLIDSFQPLRLSTIIAQSTLPDYLNIQWGYNPSQIGLLQVIRLVPSAITCIIAGRIYDRIGDKLRCFSALLLDGAFIALSGILNQNTSIVPLTVTTSANENFASMYKATTLVEAMYATNALKSINESTTDNDDDSDDNTDGSIARAYGLANISLALGIYCNDLLFTLFLMYIIIDSQMLNIMFYCCEPLSLM